MCGTVRFADGIGELLLDDQGRVLVELGAGQSLGSFVKQHPAYARVTPVIPTLRAPFQEQRDDAYLLAAVGRLWLAGIEPDWASFYRDERRLKLSLPTYAFDQQRYWVEAAKPSATAGETGSGKIADIGRWFYTETWSEVALVQAEQATDVSWLVLFDDHPAAQALAAKLRAKAGRVVTVASSPDRIFAQPRPDHYLVDAAEPEQWKRMIGELRQAGFVPNRIVHLGMLTDEQDFDALQARGYLSLLSLMQALGEHRVTAPVQLDIVSNGLYAALPDDVVSPAKGTLIGATRTIAQEYQNVTVRSVDLAGAGTVVAERLLAEIASQAKDVAVAYRGDTRLVQGYAADPLDEVAAERDLLRQGGVYVVTGGLGNVGLTLAGMLTRRYAAKVALLSRRAFPEQGHWDQWLAEHAEDDAISRQIAALLDMQAAGGQVVVLTADVADEAQMGEAFAWIDEHYGQVHGVFHAAGLITGESHSIIASASKPQVDRHYASKVHGTLVLSRLLASRQADFCLLFSSVSTVLGGLTLSAYAAANAFEDSFALAQRRAGGTRWISVNWDTWARPEGVQDHKGTTLEAFLMWPEEGAEAVRRVLGSSQAHRLINSTADLQARLDQWVYRKFAAASAKSERKTSYYARPAVSTAYVAASNEIEKRVARVFQDVLGIEKVGLEDNFFELGGNSLISLQVLAELQREFELQLSPILIFEAPSVSTISKHLLTVCRVEASVVAEAPAPLKRRRSKRGVQHADIAIIGMAARAPGAQDVETLWSNALHGVESMTRFSDEELLAVGVDPALVRNPDYVKIRGIVADIDLFDPGVFGMSPREAELMDPQHRLMLEIAWQTMEHAGYDSHRYDGAIGVFAGTMPSDYQARLFLDQELWDGLNEFDTHLANTPDSLTTRISYKLNLNGPSLSVGTYCSTSGVAIHLACQSLRSGESDMALAGAISLHVPSQRGHLFVPGDQGSPDGHTRTFDARAQGTVFSDGAGMVLLKRLDDALADGDTIHAVIKGSAVNNDGSLKAGFTAPSVERQAEVVAMAIDDAELSAADIHYVEAHGTATELGDPIEFAALTRAYRESTDKVGYCSLGSIKTNIGHTDRAAGVIGVIKALHVLKTGVVPPTLHYERPNPKIDLANSPFVVSNQQQALPALASPWRAGVTVLGVGGTNAHIILEQSPVSVPSTGGKTWNYLALSAKTSGSLDAMRENLANALDADAGINLADAAFTLQYGRREFGERLAVVGRDRDEVIRALRGQASDRCFRSAGNAGKRPVAFLFPGVGEQYVGMAAGLYAAEATFRQDMDACFELLETELGLDLRPVLFAEAAQAPERAKQFLRGEAPQDEASLRLSQTQYAQPCMFVVEYCLARLLMSWGIVPEALLGYSVGEFAAAAIAGILSLPDALRLVVGRARIIAELPGGAMLAVPLSADQLKPMLGAELAIGISNGPNLTIVSGPEAAIAELEAALAARDVVSRRLQTSHAFHSPMMEGAAAALRQLLSTVELHAPQRPCLSNVTGAWISAADATDREYWVRHMCQTARFAECLDTLWSRGDWAVVEVGPGQSLTSLVKQQALGKEHGAAPIAITTMRTTYVQDDDQAVLTAALAKLWVSGVAIDGEAYYAGEQRRRIPLPTYAFDRQRYWIEAEIPGASLASRLLTQAEKSPLADAFYLPLWKPAGAADGALKAPTLTAGSCWLVFADADGIGDALAAAVRPLGIETVLVRRGGHYAVAQDGSISLRATKKEDYVAVLKELKRRGLVPSRIVHLWAAEAWNADLSTHLTEHLDRGFYSLFHLAQAVGERLADTPIELYIVASDLEPVLGTESIHPAKATLRGPCKVIRQEYATVACRSIDLFSSDEEALSAERLGLRLAAEILSGAEDQFSAFRDGQRWVPFVEPVRIEAPFDEVPRIREEGVYFVTGGLGGIGFAFAEHMYRTRHAKLVLVGRSGLPPREEWSALLAANQDDRVTERVRKISSLIEAGAELLLITADVADPAQMADAVRQAIERFGTINGVFHAAGLPGQGLTQLKTVETAATVMAPKIQGTLALDRAFAGVELDFMVLVSSIASFTGGGPGQIDYCAANAFLDAFAQRHRAKHGMTVSISFGEWQWDAWSEGLKGFQPEMQEAMRSHRRQFGISFEEGMEGIRRILALDVPQMILLPEDAVAMIAGSNSCSVTNISNAVQQTRGRRMSAYPRPALSNPFVAAESDIERQVATVWQEVLGIEQVGIDDNFFDLGGNSLVGLQLIGRINRDLDMSIPLSCIYEYSTVRRQAEMTEEILMIQAVGLEQEQVDTSLSGDFIEEVV
jgi:acyl transferase domain-containing protein/acyl carrier protein